MRLVSVNVNGIRSATDKGFLDWMAQQQADVVCVQEVKATEADLSSTIQSPVSHPYAYFACAEKKGYSGVAIYAKLEPVSIIRGFGVDEFDQEGRLIEADFGDFSVVSLYLPSGSAGEHRQASKFRFLAAFFPWLQQRICSGKPTVLCGDWNIAHHPIDLKNWRSNQKNSGFLPEERAWLTEVLTGLGWVDVYRTLHPTHEGEAYTWWSQRGQAYQNNVGWRIDYQIATPDLAQAAHAAYVDKSRKFSDHAPLVVDYNFKLH